MFNFQYRILLPARVGPLDILFGDVYDPLIYMEQPQQPQHQHQHQQQALPASTAPPVPPERAATRNKLTKSAAKNAVAGGSASAAAAGQLLEDLTSLNTPLANEIAQEMRDERATAADAAAAATAHAAAEKQHQLAKKVKSQRHSQSQPPPQQTTFAEKAAAAAAAMAASSAPPPVPFPRRSSSYNTGKGSSSSSHHGSHAILGGGSGSGAAAAAYDSELRSARPMKLRNNSTPSIPALAQFATGVGGGLEEGGDIDFYESHDDSSSSSDGVSSEDSNSGGGEEEDGGMHGAELGSGTRRRRGCYKGRKTTPEDAWMKMNMGRSGGDGSGDPNFDELMQEDLQARLHEEDQSKQQQQQQEEAAQQQQQQQQKKQTPKQKQTQTQTAAAAAPPLDRRGRAKAGGRRGPQQQQQPGQQKGQAATSGEDSRGEMQQLQPQKLQKTQPSASSFSEALFETDGAWAGIDDSNVLYLDADPPSQTAPGPGPGFLSTARNLLGFAGPGGPGGDGSGLPRGLPQQQHQQQQPLRSVRYDVRTIEIKLDQLTTKLQQEQRWRLEAEEAARLMQWRAEAAQRNAEALEDQAARLHEEAERHKRGHERVLKDLNRFKAGQGVSQVSDDFLTQKAQELRQDIRDFALQYFEGDVEGMEGVAGGEGGEGGEGVEGGAPPGVPPGSNTKLADLMRFLGPADPFTTFLRSPTRRPSAVQAFLWVVLAKTIFNGWYFAGAGRLPLFDMFQLMRPDDLAYAVLHHESRDPADHDAERRFYTWRATTARFVIDRPSSCVRYSLVRKLVTEIGAVLDPYLVDGGGGGDGDGDSAASAAHEELLRIVHKAIDFDRETSQQASRLEWIVPRAPGQAAVVPDGAAGAGADGSGGGGGVLRVPFDPDYMELDTHETLDGNVPEVLLAVAPGLRKRGRSNGEDFTVETMLLKMEVTCEPVTDAEEM